MRINPALALALALLAAPLAAQTAMPAAAQVPVAPPAAPDSARGVRAGDVVNVWVWREAELTGEFPVDARGRVVLPMLGEIAVLGKAAETLADELRIAYRRYLSNPSIRITVLRRIAVQGAVARAGLYPVDATMTVADVIALAGGVTGGGDVRKVRLVRGGRIIETVLGAETILERSAVQSGDEIFVPERSWFARNSTSILWAALSATTAILVSAATR